MSHFKETVKRRSAENDHRSMSVPSIDEQFKDLPPSRELVQFYRNKLAFYEKEFTRMTEKVNVCRRACNADGEIRNELRRCSDEVFVLQKALSDMQVCLLQERNQVISLHSVNDLLKIQIAKDNRTKHFLLSLCDITEDKLALMMNESESEWLNKTREIQNKVSLKIPMAEGRRDTGAKGDTGILLQKINVLEGQLKELTTVSQDEIYSLHKDREVLLIEKEKEYQRLQDQIAVFADRLSTANADICKLTSELITMKKEFVKKEEKVILEKERERLRKHSFGGATKELEKCDNKSKTHTESVLKSFKDQLQHKEKIIKSYKEQCSSLENELLVLNSSRDLSAEVLQIKVEKMNEQLTYMRDQYQKLQKKRNFEAEGFRNDVRMLKERLHSLERKSVYSQASAPQQKELMVNARETYLSAKLLEKELVMIKNKVMKMNLMK